MSTTNAGPGTDGPGQTVDAAPLIDITLLSANPGTYEDLHKKIGPSIFDGFKFTLNKMLSSHFQVNHSLTMSNIAPSGYKFGATYLGNKQISPSEVTINKHKSIIYSYSQ